MEKFGYIIGGGFRGRMATRMGPSGEDGNADGTKLGGDGNADDTDGADGRGF